MPAALMVVGLGLIGLGWGWNAVVPTKAYWGPEQAEEYIAAQADLHSKTHDHDRAGDHEREFAAARERFVSISQQLDEARVARDRIGTYIAGSGILLILVGIGLHLANKPAS